MRSQAPLQSSGQWRQLIEDWKRSGLSGARFCQVNHVVYHRFVYWRQKLSSLEMRQEASASGGFVAVYRNAQPVDENADLSLSLPNGAIIRGIRADNVGVVRLLLDSL